MVTEAQIKEINYITNTCKVHVPLFDVVSDTSKTILNAYFAIPPGVYNGYVIGDKVWISFENNHVETPIVIGKIFERDTVNAKDLYGVVACKNLKVQSSVNLPVTNTIFDGDQLTPDGTVAGYDSLKALLLKVKSLEDKVNELEGIISQITTNNG